MAKLRLGINIDHVATLRNARDRRSLAKPDLIRAASEALKGGADSITFHLREDRRHILDSDLKHLFKHIKAPLNLEMAATNAMAKIALTYRPHAVCIVPERRREVTTEGGLDVSKSGAKLARIVNKLAAQGIRVSLFINPNASQILAAWMTGAKAVELHTGAYASAKGSAQKKELQRIERAAHEAHKLGLEVHAGHGLTYQNVRAICKIPEIVELNIGHFLVGEALFVGLTQSVRHMAGLMHRTRRSLKKSPKKSG